MKNIKKLIVASIFAVFVALAVSMVSWRIEVSAKTFDDNDLHDDIRDGYSVEDVRELLEENSGFNSGFVSQA